MAIADLPQAVGYGHGRDFHTYFDGEGMFPLASSNLALACALKATTLKLEKPKGACLPLYFKIPSCLGPLYTRSKGPKKLGANFEHIWVANWTPSY